MNLKKKFNYIYKDISIEPGDPEIKYKDALRRRWRKLYDKQKSISWYNIKNFIGGFILIVLSLVIYFALRTFQAHVYKNEILYILAIPFLLIGIYFMLKPFLRSTREEDVELQILEIEMAMSDLIGDKEADVKESTEDDAERLFRIERRAEMRLRIHTNELRMYYLMILDQAGKIFNIGIGAMLIGFSIIGFTLYVLLKYRNTMDFDEELLTAILGTVAGILSNFIAVIYLQMHAKTIECLREFHKRMVFTNNMYISNLMASKISDEKLRYRTYRDVAKLLVQDKGK